MKRTPETLCLSVAVILAAYNVALAQRQDTAFVFTGQLNAQISQSSQTCEFEFTLWNEMEGGQRVGRTLAFDGWESNRPRVPIKNNQYEVILDFGLSIDDSEYLWVEARYSCGRGAPWTTMEDRTAIDEEMYFTLSDKLALDDKPEPARFNNKRSNQIIDPVIIDEVVTGTPDGHSLDAADGDPIDAVFVDNDGNVGVGTLTPTSTLEVAGDLTVDGPIRIDGDNNPLEIYVNGVRALRFEYADALSEAPNFIAGHPENAVVPQKAGATIGGGGGTGIGKNQVSEDWGTVSGGKGNHAFGLLGTVGGGQDNTATGEGSTVSGGMGGTAGGFNSVVSGGLSNSANGLLSTVGGGAVNIADGRSSTIAGGEGNIASGDYATVPGGFVNEATGNYSFAAGRRAKANHAGSFVWGDSTAADFTSTRADQFRVRASGGASFANNVGIGTTTPGIPLTFANSLGNKISLWGQDGAADHFGFGIQSLMFQMYANPNSSIAFGHGRSESFTERMRIATNGNVGIGTATPSTRLHLMGGTDSALASGGYLTIGPTNGLNLSLDENELMARNNGSTSTLFLNNDGGQVRTGANLLVSTNLLVGTGLVVGTDLVVNGLIRSANQNFKIRRGSFQMGGNFTLGFQGWAASSFSYGTTFTSKPVILISWSFASTNPADGNSGILITARNIGLSSSGFTVRNAINASAVLNNGRIHWIAIGQ